MLSKISMKRLLVGLLVVSIVAVFAGFAAAKENEKVISVGDETVGEDELVLLLVKQAGVQKNFAPFVLAQTTMAQRKDFANHVVAALLLSQAAQMEGLQLDPETALALRWNAINVLAQSYINKISGSWSFKEEDLRKYYEQNKDKYVRPEAVHVRHILVDSKEKADRVLLEILAKEKSFSDAAKEYSQDSGSASKGGDLGWIQRGQTVKEFEDLIFSIKEKSLGGPVETQYGWHVVEVLEKSPSKQLTFEEALPKIREDIQQWYLDKEIEKLKGRFEVSVDESKLSTLGGFPAIQ
ncbi:PpiC-type peptidyl-prolyl cis-trans isomerase [Thermovirga lienii DSM 17291]|uniref:PpiC-type peptidyl-prolyl cis-trans isomerase n=1 Tax=Thermovirga lienii (strain ATCC BAA-1197 / DSM 17291 / Cas60314) TaxID=580340 RepID=G7V6L4_THELD|nr:peptidylprolyl isomerase [Thermovirga lienii]AER67127.1 PpiC-type peptidyl-prolyl cis-trans isomerase [Thermovirga lienii DSM 17291]KUK42131.1 MAG: PpiC-type peptidyl-prolyl cis-trans isomerase [Thermovirga lienii]